MKIVNKRQMQELIEQHPDGGIVFCDYEPDAYVGTLEVTDGDFGATQILPWHGEAFDYDWNILEYADNDLFAVFDHEDILLMIQTLTKGLSLDLRDDAHYSKEYFGLD